LSHNLIESVIRDTHPDLWQNGSDIKCLHYILDDEPWRIPPNMRAELPDARQDITNQWWDRYDCLRTQMLLSGMDVEATYLSGLVASGI